MGDKNQATRRRSRALKCRWCGQVLVGQTWMADRRKASDSVFSKEFCPRCRAVNFADYTFQPAGRKDIHL